jgi:superfamily I DNA/RNA helicase
LIPPPENPSPEELDDYYNNYLPSALLEAVSELDIHYDAIVVDEGQDFHDNWWAVLEMLLHHPRESIFYIFYDDNQRIYSRQSKYPITGPPYLLTKNCRNTQQIHEQVLKFYSGSHALSARGPRGRRVEIAKYQDDSELYQIISRVLSKLVNEEKVPASETVILTPSKRSSLWKHSSASGIKFSDSWPPAEGQVYLSTIHTFKGLEVSVVIVAEIDAWSPDKGPIEPILYVACSRARNHLVVLLRTDESSKLKGYFTGR